MGDYDSVFRELVADPLKMEGCAFNRAAFTKSKVKADPGGGLECNLHEYAKFMRAIYAQTFVSTELPKEAERAQTTHASSIPEDNKMAGGPFVQYALGSWRDCVTDKCSDDDGVKVHSAGVEGFYPWIWRKGDASHWGILARQGGLLTGLSDSNEIMEGAFSLMGVPHMMNESSTHLLSGSCGRWAMQAVIATLIAGAN